MNSIIRKFVGAAALACLAFSASAEVLTFDDRPAADWQFFTAPYHGFTFKQDVNCQCSWYSSNFTDADGPYYKSAGNAAWTTSKLDANGDPIVADSEAIVSDAPVIFKGAWFQSYVDNVDVTFELWLGSDLKATTAPMFMDMIDDAKFLDSGYTGPVDKIVVKGLQGYFAMDDFTFERIPEPGSVTLVLAALGGLAFTARRRRDDKA